jgi:DNA polymerase-3 subunit delta
LDGGALKGENIRSITDAVNCFPFVSQKRVVRVTEFYPSEKDYESYLKPLFDNPPSDGLLMIINSAKPKAGQAVLSKKAGVTYVDCTRSDEETIKKWIYGTCKREGLFIDGVTCGMLAQYCVLDMARIAKETEKLLCYCTAENVTRLTDEIVSMLVYPDSEYKIYELSSAVSRKNYDGYVKIMNELSAKGFDEASLLATLAAHFKGLYEVSRMKGSDRDIATALGLKEFSVKKNREQANKFTKDRLLYLYESTFDAISAFKCGETSQSSALKLITAKIFF